MSGGMQRPGDALPSGWAGLAQWRVLDVGSDSGERFLAAWAAWRADPRRPRLLHWLACREAPQDPARLLRAMPQDSPLQPLAQALAAGMRGLLPGVHRFSFDDGRVLLTLYLGALQPLLRQQQPVADAIHLHAGDAGSAQQLADPRLCKALARCARRGTRLLAEGLPAQAAAALQGSGFALAQAGADGACGVPALQAVFDPPWQPRAGQPPLPDVALPPGRAPGECLVIGAGLAGAAVATSLARRGWRVTVLDAAEAPAAGASGLPAGVFASHVSPDDSLLSRLSRAGVRCTLQALAQLLPDGRGTLWDDGGVLEHDPDAPPRLAWTQGPGLDWSRPASADALRANGLAPDAPACWHPLGGWVRPAQLVRRLLAEPGIRWQGGARVERLQRARNGAWQALDTAGALLAQGELAVVCAGPASAGVAGTPLSLQLLRGQIAWGLHGPAPAHPVAALPIEVTASRQHAAALPCPLFPPQPVNGHGNLVPRVPLDLAQGAPGWVLGSTFERDQGVLPVSAADRQAGLAHNLDQLRMLLPPLARALAPGFAQAGTDAGVDAPADPAAPCTSHTQRSASAPVHTWAAVRCTAPDRLPLVGPVDAQAQPGLWLSTAMGARGLTLALLCGELLAARLHGEPLPLEARLARALGSERLAEIPAKQPRGPDRI
ncbi:tRNA 5-methylaminomethyl-2-thiouridine biosynthesis bifunctional protein [Oryzisolibacter propanilivorax]|uniref:tRNA 5-methylaminomethyl-2-thiouridine biosynthesis bifunctional protein n=2 Tax=Oryzisolibacter propanilivorax TaxID=1527607 RepID=A0A1G9ULV9_9BURK|nr:tRNA 5-methylaminomethyl-2-thiouridine biosynthesis bifunctional protein [Oryzisolibacter propanilivorax]